MSNWSEKEKLTILKTVGGIISTWEIFAAASFKISITGFLEWQHSCSSHPLYHFKYQTVYEQFLTSFLRVLSSND